MKYLLGKIIKLFLSMAVIFLLFIASSLYFSINADAASKFIGDGTFDNPYLLYSSDDLVQLSRAVNEEYKNYSDQYFALANDIDMSDVEFTPIGISGSDHYFFGVFDGNGYAIKSISINAPDSDNGLFGMLGGTVVNLKIHGGNITGACCGVISSHAASSQALIANCEVKNVTVVGSRAGGLVDDFDGSVINSVSNGCCLNGRNCYGGISSCAVRGDSYGNYYSYDTDFADIAEEKTIDGTEQIVFDDQNLERITNNLNTNYRYQGNNSLPYLGMCNIWVSSEDGTPQLSETKQTEIFLSNLANLTGSGSADDPYIINNADDLCIFRNAVNSGYDFYGEYVRQNADIDLSNEIWTPAGQYGNGNYFYGIYDGAGHIISNITTSSKEYIGGFFGMLGGTVVNLGIESGLIQGGYCGAIAGLAASNSVMVVNCYNKANVVGTGRAGGIVDNFNGSVIGCWSDCYLEGNSVGGIASYSAENIYLCMTSYNYIVPKETMQGKIVDSEDNKTLSGTGTQEAAKELDKNFPKIKELSGGNVRLYTFSAENEQLHFSNKPYTFDLGQWIKDNTRFFFILLLIISIYLCMFFKIGPEKFYEDERRWWERFVLVFSPVFLFSYMFLIHSPIEFFITNNNEFDFVFSDFAYRFIAFAVVFSVVFSSLAALVKGKICDILACAVLGLDLAMYIQLNFMNRSLGLLDGTEKTVNVTGNYINLGIWIILLVLPFALFFIFVKFRRKVIISICGILCLMQIASIVVLVAQSPSSAFKRDLSQYSLNANDQFRVSANKNIIVLVIDAYSNSYLDEFFEEYPEVKEVVKDFTYYNNADCHYEGSVYSVNYIASGTEWDPSISINEWCTTAWDNERNNHFYSRLKEQKYVCNIYSMEPNYLSNVAKHDMVNKVSNMIESEYGYQINDEVMFNLFMNASMYRFAPMILKENYEFTASDYSSAYTLISKSNKGIDTSIKQGNAEFYQELLKRGLQTDDSGNYYILQHFLGVHPPYTTNDKCENVTQASLLETERGCWRYIEEYLNQLRELGVYDNATIIITADHGEHHEYHDAQPIFFIKNENEVHNAYPETNAPISFTDIMPTVMYLAGGEYSDLGTTIYEHNEDEQRERTLFVRMYDESLPKVPKIDSPTKSILNCFYKYVYTGDIEDLRAVGDEGPTEKVPWTDAFY